jgi:hypothetical protein
MKKIIFLMATAMFILTGCVKNKEIYRGESKQFNYTPSFLNPTLVGLPVNGIATVAVGGQLLSLRCITPGNTVADAIVIDAPVFPAGWDWSIEGNEYRPSGMVYNNGFSANYGTCYFVEILNGVVVFHKGVYIPMDPINTAYWVSSFEYPRTWVQTLPIRAMVSKTSATNYRLVIP